MRAALGNSGRAPSISTYFSRLGGSGTLEQLWRGILDHARVHPMIQDGVGVAGLDNLKALEPLRRLLLARHAPFDLVIELFEELPSGSTDGSTFKARSADFERVRKQWLIADSYGAQRVVAFALDPGHRRQPEARVLRQAWMRARADACRPSRFQAKPRPMISRMISLVPPNSRSARASDQARPMPYSAM